jgi:hypothetical protein
MRLVMSPHDLDASGSKKLSLQLHGLPFCWQQQCDFLYEEKFTFNFDIDVNKDVLLVPG